jgi:hypothetical protein
MFGLRRRGGGLAVVDRRKEIYDGEKRNLPLPECEYHGLHLLFPYPARHWRRLRVRIAVCYLGSSLDLK